MKTKKTKLGQKGFTLLLAALVASTVLSIGAAVYTIAFKQVELSAIGRDSQFAFYVADSASECSLFWDFRTDISSHNGQSFATSSNYANTLPSVTCDEQTVPVTVIDSSSTGAVSTFYYAPSFNSTQGRCAQVTVTKFYNAATLGVNTVIHADGYSTVVSGTPSQQAAACTPTTVSGDPAPIPPAVLNDPNARLQRSVELSM